MKWAMLYIQGSEFRKKLDDTQSKLNARINEVLRFGVNLYQTLSRLNFMNAKALALSQSLEEANVFDFQFINNGGVILITKTY
jgi:hypothetical protein